MSTLTTAQFALYTFLKYRGDQYTSLIDIAKALPEFYQITDAANFHNTGTRLRITKDIAVLKESDEIDHIIISNTRGVKIANEREFSESIGKEYADAIRRLQRARKRAKKASTDGQMLINIDGTGEKSVDAFLRNPIRHGQNLGRMTDKEYNDLFDAARNPKFSGK